MGDDMSHGGGLAVNLGLWVLYGHGIDIFNCTSAAISTKYAHRRSSLHVQIVRQHRL